MLLAVGIAKSSYYYQKDALSLPEKYIALRKEVKEVFSQNRCGYDYRRVHAVVKKQGVACAEKGVQRIMSEEHLFVQGKKKRMYRSYLDEISLTVSSPLERDFHSEKPNDKWLDLTEFHIPAGRVGLSPIIDCFDGMVVSWTIGTSPGAELVKMMLDGAIACLSDVELPVIRTERGCHYRWSGQIWRMDAAVCANMKVIHYDAKR